MKKATLIQASNGFCEITTDSLIVRMKLGILLTIRYGFYRWGVCIPAVTDDAIHPSFIRFNQCILTGWDNWMGYYLLAENEETDSFLRFFYQKHGTT